MQVQSMNPVAPVGTGTTATSAAATATGAQQGGFSDMLMQLLGGGAATGMGTGEEDGLFATLQNGQEGEEELLEFLGSINNTGAMEQIANMLLGGQVNPDALQNPMAYKDDAAMAAMAQQQMIAAQRMALLGAQNAESNLQQLAQATQQPVDGRAFAEAVAAAAQSTGTGLGKPQTASDAANIAADAAAQAAKELGATIAEGTAAGTRSTNGFDPLLSSLNKLYAAQEKNAAGTPKQEASGELVAGGAVSPQLQAANELATPAELLSVSPKDVLEQVRAGITKNLQAGEKNEFVIKLKPEGLGSITVKLTETAGKISLSIITATQYAQNALSSEVSSLREALKPYNAEIQQIVVNDSTAFAQQQSMGEHRHQNSEQQQRTQYGWEQQVQEQQVAESHTQVVGSALNAYI